MADEILRSYGDTNIKADIAKLIELLTARPGMVMWPSKTESDKVKAEMLTLGKQR